MTDTEVFEKNDNMALESYNFTYSEEEYDETSRSNLRSFTVRTVVLGVMFAVITAGIVMSDMTDFFGGMLAGWTLMYFVISLVGLLGTRKNWKATKARICSSVFKYELFNDYLLLTVTKDGECVHFTKLEYDKLRRKTDTGRLYLLDFANQGYMIKKQEIAENSIFHSLKPKAPEKPSKTLKGISVALLVLSIVSGVCGVLYIGLQMFNYGAMEWWYLLAFGSVPLASFIFGIYMKKYGVGRGNVIAGLFAFAFIIGMFYAGYSDGPEIAGKYAKIEAIESYIDIDLPEPSFYETYSDTANGVYYQDTVMQFYSKGAENIESKIQSDDKWITSIPDEIYELVEVVGTPYDWDYFTIYNIFEDEYNKIPDKSGTYNMAAVYYYTEYNQFIVTEYEYTK